MPKTQKEIDSIKLSFPLTALKKGMLMGPKCDYLKTDITGAH